MEVLIDFVYEDQSFHTFRKTTIQFDPMRFGPVQPTSHEINHPTDGAQIAVAQPG